MKQNNSSFVLKTEIKTALLNYSSFDIIKMAFDEQEDGQMQKRGWLHTVRGQYMLIVLLTLLGITILIGVVSAEVVRDVVQSRGKAYMESSVQLLSEDMEREYYDILHISQHMMPQGQVGEDLNKILSATTVYDEGEAKRMLARDMGLITVSVRQSELALYCDAAGQTVVTGTMSVDPTFHAKENLSALYQNKQVTYHAIHPSQSFISNQPVISLARSGTFYDDKEYTIYVEIRTSLLDSLEAMCKNANTSYDFLLLNADGKICYSSQPDLPIGTELFQVMSPQIFFGTWQNWTWARSDTRLGFSCAVIQKNEYFYAGLLKWVNRLLVAFVVAVCLIVLSAVLLKKKIYQKMEIVFQAIDGIGQNSLTIVSPRTGLAEFDMILDRFESMLCRIRQLILDVEKKEADRAKTELEKLYYQINPHFLMNSLNSVHWLARMNGQEDIRNMVHRLCVILSYSMGRSVEYPTLRTEVDILRNYIALESERHSFTTTFDIEEGSYLDNAAPRLVLQPLVENAIGHGMDVDGELYISIHPQQKGAVIIIRDDGCGITDEKLQEINNGGQGDGKGGIGLRYVRSMIQQFYGKEASLHFTSKQGEGTTVTLYLGIPLREGET